MVRVVMIMISLRTFIKIFLKKMINDHSGNDDDGHEELHLRLSLTVVQFLHSGTSWISGGSPITIGRLAFFKQS